jgi:hypothetical protein
MKPLPFNRRPFYEQLGMSSWMRKKVWSTRNVILDEKKITRNQACRLGWETIY